MIARLRHELAHLLRLNKCRTAWDRAGFECIVCGRYTPWVAIAQLRPDDFAEDFARDDEEDP